MQVVSSKRQTVVVEMPNDEDSVNARSKFGLRTFETAVGFVGIKDDKSIHYLQSYTKKQYDAIRGSIRYLGVIANLDEFDGSPSHGNPLLPLGLQWKEVGSQKPSMGTEIKNDVLAAVLQEKVDFQKVEFKKEEWETFQVSNLSSDSYIKVGNRYFKPAVNVLGRNMLGSAAIPYRITVDVPSKVFMTKDRTGHKFQENMRKKEMSSAPDIFEGRVATTVMPPKEMMSPEEIPLKAVNDKGTPALSSWPADSGPGEESVAFVDQLQITGQGRLNVVLCDSTSGCDLGKIVFPVHKLAEVREVEVHTHTHTHTHTLTHTHAHTHKHTHTNTH
jgi:hypothetical protein